MHRCGWASKGHRKVQRRKDAFTAQNASRQNELHASSPVARQPFQLDPAQCLQLHTDEKFWMSGTHVLKHVGALEPVADALPSTIDVPGVRRLVTSLAHANCLVAGDGMHNY